MRTGRAPNLRTQDGPKQRLLCGGCESRLSIWENDMAQRLFRPYHHDTSTVVTYGPWLARFYQDPAFGACLSRIRTRQHMQRIQAELAAYLRGRADRH